MAFLCGKKRRFLSQFNRNIPWATIEMDFMNLNQAAHGHREYGTLLTRLRLNRKAVVGHWQEPGVRQYLAADRQVKPQRTGLHRGGRHV